MNSVFFPGRPWYDTDGNLIQAHGGSIIQVKDTFYWYGENKEKTLPWSDIWHYGVRMYSSKDLNNWKNEGLVMPPSGDIHNPMHPTRIMDRPHIIYNTATATFVMWLKFCGDEETRDFSVQKMGVATATSVTGPYTLQKVFRPCGMDAGDFDVCEAEGKGYLIFEHPHTEMVFAELTDDYQDVTGNYTKTYTGRHPIQCREAPAHFLRGGKHYLLTSGTSGYFPNPTEAACTEKMLGEWTEFGQICEGDVSGTSFSAQFSSVFKYPYKEDTYIALGDRWLPDFDVMKYGQEALSVFQDRYDGKPSLGQGTDIDAVAHQNSSIARYVWLPIVFEDDRPVIRWCDSWTL